MNRNVIATTEKILQMQSAEDLAKAIPMILAIQQTY